MGSNAYFGLYPKCRSDGSNQANKTGIDSSPSYIRELDVPRKVMETYGAGDAQRLVFVLMLRDPVARTFSEYFHNLYGGPGNCKKWCDSNCSGCTFDDWAAVQLRWAERVNARYGPGKLWPPVLSKELHKGEFRLHASFYALQLKNWLDAGFHATQFVAVAFDVYNQVGVQERKEMYEYILGQASLRSSDSPELEMGEIAGGSARNSRAHGHEPMSEKMMSLLRTFFAQPNEDLYALLKSRHITLLPKSAVGVNFLGGIRS